MITREELIAAVPELVTRPDTAARYLPHLIAALVEFDITTRQRVEAFLAQMGHESNGFTRLSENMNYSASRLRQVFPKYFPTYAVALAYANRPEAIANRVYANRLGNGPPSSGDGWRYRGNGITHLTGRANHREAGRALGVDFEAHPELAREPEHMFRVAGWFWKSRGLNALADRGQFEAITRRINGGTNGQPDRLYRWGVAKRALAASALPASPPASRVLALTKPAIGVGAVATAGGAAAAHQMGLGERALEWATAHPVGVGVIALLLILTAAAGLFIAVRWLREANR